MVWIVMLAGLVIFFIAVIVSSDRANEAGKAAAVVEEQERQRWRDRANQERDEWVAKARAQGLPEDYIKQCSEKGGDQCDGRKFSRAWAADPLARWASTKGNWPPITNAEWEVLNQTCKDVLIARGVAPKVASWFRNV